MTTQERLIFYLQESIKRCTNTQARRVSLVLAEVLPDILKTLHALILDPNATASEKLESLRMLNGFIKRCERGKKLRKQKPVKIPEMSDEDFASKLLHISDETADLHFKQMQAANERWRLKYHGGL